MRGSDRAPNAAAPPNTTDAFTGRTLPTRHPPLPGSPLPVTAAQSLLPAAATSPAPKTPLQRFTELLNEVSSDDSGDEPGAPPNLVSVSDSDSSDGGYAPLGDPALPSAAACKPGVARHSSLATDLHQEADSQDPLTRIASRFPAGQALSHAAAQVTPGAAPPPSAPRSSHLPRDGSVADATYVQLQDPLRPPAGQARAAVQDPLARIASRFLAGQTHAAAQVTSGAAPPPSAPLPSLLPRDGSVADATYLRPAPGPAAPPSRTDPCCCAGPAHTHSQPLPR